MKKFRLCRKSELSSSTLHKFWAFDRSVIATLDVNGLIYAFESTCPHAQKTLQQADWDADSGILTCRFHWVEFNLRENGKWLSGPQCNALQMYSTELDGEDVFIIFP